MRRVRHAVLVAFIFLAASGNAGADVPKSNVLLIIADDLRPDLACYGVAAVQSPNIDKLAARGVRFDRAYCQYPVCNPSRVSFLTGLRPDATQVLGNDVPFRTKLPDVVTLPQYFRANGYVTIGLGKVFHRGGNVEDVRGERDDPASWSLARYFTTTAVGKTGEGRNLTGGKVDWCRWLAANGEDEDQPDGQIARDAVALMEKHRDEPFFLAVGFHKPHDPFVAPKKYFDLYPLDQIKLNVDPPDQSPAPPPAIAGQWLDEFAKFTDAERREFIRAYRAGTTFMDAQVGKVLDALNQLQLSDRTIIIFLGDHGYHLGERGWWNKSTLFELSARAPLIIAAPGVEAGVFSRPIEFVDLYPTLVELCRLPARSDLHGQSLAPLMREKRPFWDKPALTQVRRGKFGGRSVRTERFRYTEWDEGRQGVELYDHENDPGEHKNLA
ncbi:MAG: iduronate 2-sulfatase, partial [Humisphaera sp.]|nr:iduronate 2-sulfatase [Humisphaera sp.]